ncbi:O-antigen ligase family protein [Onishia taeanensis]
MTLSSSIAVPKCRFTDFSVFLMGALSLIVSSGYSLGAAMLLLGGVMLIFQRRTPLLNKQDQLLIAILACFALYWMGRAWFDGQGTGGWDKPSRFLLAVPALLWVFSNPPRMAWLWSGLAVGALGAGGWAAWQKLVEGAARADGFTNAIQFGNISMLLGVLSLAGLGWALCQPRSRLWSLFLFVGALAGILGSLFSGSRGGWVGFPFVLLVLYKGYGGLLSMRHKGAILAALMLGVVLIYSLPQTGVQSRVHQAVEQLEGFVTDGDVRTSVGARLEMWRGASLLAVEKPVFGWGDNGYERAMQELADEGVIDSYVTQYGHAHNDFLDAFAKRGIVGLVLLIALYVWPMKLFAQRLESEDLELRAIAVAGGLLSVAYIDFGMTQVFLAHNSGVMVFAFWLATLYGTLRAREKGSRPPSIVKKGHA